MFGRRDVRIRASPGAGPAAIALLAAGVLVSLACSGSGARVGDRGSPPGAPPATSTVAAPGAALTPSPAPPRADASATAGPAPAGRASGPERPAAPLRGPEASRPESRTGKPGTAPADGAGSPGASRESGAPGASGASAGDEYTWHDGDRVRRVTLESGLVAQPTSRNAADDVVTRDYGETSIVARRERHATGDAQPVFRSSGGELMTLPGGVLLVLDDDWDQARVDRFFADNGVAAGNAERRDWAVNAFFIPTAPGLPSLTLANRLAVLEGVEISSPNWQTDVSLR